MQNKEIKINGKEVTLRKYGWTCDNYEVTKEEVDQIWKVWIEENR